MSEAPPEKWKGPVWDLITQALNDPEQAKWFSIVTARGHTPQELREAVSFLSEQGYFKYVPSLNHVFTVGQGEWKSKGLPTEKLKVIAMVMVLDKLQKEVLRRQNEGESIRGEFIFIDDDFQNFEKAEHGLSEISHRWPDVDVLVSFVGTNRPSTNPVTMLLERKKPEALFCHELVYF